MLQTKKKKKKKKMKLNINTLPLHAKLKYFNSCLREGGEKASDGWIMAGNSDKRLDTGRARAWVSRTRAGLGSKFEATQIKNYF